MKIAFVISSSTSLPEWEINKIHYTSILSIYLAYFIPQRPRSPFSTQLCHLLYRAKPFGRSRARPAIFSLVCRDIFWHLMRPLVVICAFPLLLFIYSFPTIQLLIIQLFFQDPIYQKWSKLTPLESHTQISISIR